MKLMSENIKQSISKLRLWLRRVMPRVAIATATCFILRSLAHEARFYREHLFGTFFEWLTFLLIVVTLGYYGLKTLRWLKRRLLWRVRRRLIITYLFVGLTPIILLAGLGFIFGFGMALNSIATSVMLELNSTEKQTLASAKTFADALSNLPPNADDKTVQTWLDEHNRLLQASLPGARFAVWRSTNPLDEEQAFNMPAQFVSEPAGENVRALGEETQTLGAALPSWLRGRSEWSDFCYLPARDRAQQKFGTASLSALVRKQANNRSYTVLLSVPISRAFIERLRENTKVEVRPFFNSEPLAANGKRDDEQEHTAASGNDLRDEQLRLQNARTKRVDNTLQLTRPPADQFGETWHDTQAWVVMPATNWLDGARRPHISFLFPSTVAAARRQVLERGHLGQELRLGTVLTVFGIIFLVFELLALFAAAWMTRAVTGTVHKLYRATEFIKRGDFSHRVHARSRDQLGELAEAFNEMSANIESLLAKRVEHERLEREVEIAAEVQAQLFPREVPRLIGAEIIGECRAARGVAGDYYDYVEIARGLITFALGDVSGKGISASLVMSNLQASLRAQATILTERLKMVERAAAVAVASGNEMNVEMPCGVTGVDTACAVESMTSSINDQLCRSTDSNRFATLFLALYDERTRHLRYTNAGHNAGILVRVDGTVEQLTAGGMMVGAFDFARYEEASTTLAAGDLLLLFSDGITEAQNTLGEEYSEARLMQFTVERRTQTADELRRAIFAEIDNWSGGRERGDDQTIVILKAVTGDE